MPRELGVLDYKIKEQFDLHPGQVIEIPFRKRMILGVVYKINKTSKFSAAKLKELPKPWQVFLTLDSAQVELGAKIAHYYHRSLSEIFILMVPAVPKRIATPRVKSFNIGKDVVRVSQKTKKKIEHIMCSIKKKYFLFDYDPTLKYEFVLAIIEQQIKQGKQVMIMLPHLLKIKKFIEFLPKKYADELAVITSQTLSSKTAHFQIWKDIEEGNKKIIIATRLGVFFSFKNLGAVFVDFAHSQDYKNYDQNPRYHTLDILQWQQAQHNNFLFFASPCPRVEDYYQANNEAKKWGQITLGKIDWSPLVINFKDIYQTSVSKYFSETLMRAINDNLAKKQKVLLIVNRRGLATSVLCADCNYVALCPTCQLPFSISKDGNLMCFRCNQRAQVFVQCPKCKGTRIKQIGFGLEQIKQEVAKLFPGEEGQITVATSDILQELVWQKFGLIGIVYVDSLIYLSDFYSNFKLYQQLLEIMIRPKLSRSLDDPLRVVARDDIKCARDDIEIILQTNFPDNQAIKLLSAPYADFYKQELTYRKQFSYPPFCKLIKLIFQHDNEKMAQKNAQAIFNNLQIKAEKTDGKIQVLGPYPYYAKQVRKKYRWQILLKTTANLAMEEKLLADLGPEWLIDKDPVSLL